MTLLSVKFSHYKI